MKPHSTRICINTAFIHHLGFAIALCMMSLQTQAHHSYAATYDVSKPVEIHGEISEMSWRNPHAFLFVRTEDETGNTVIWEFELSPTVMLIRSGWKPDMVKAGDPVSVKGFIARDTTSHRAAAREVILKDGTSLIAGPGEGEVKGGAR